MKSILISIKPKYVARILNGEKTIEIRKNMPKCDLPIDVYIYCTKDKEHLYRHFDNKFKVFREYNKLCSHNGKVVAKFTLNKVEEIELNRNHFVNEQYSTDELNYEELLEQSCLSYRELDDYLQCETGYAWHISNLVIFDKPKELSEFGQYGYEWFIPIEKAPQSFMFIEVE